MAHEIRIPAPMRRLTNGERTIRATGATLAAALQDAVRQHPDLAGRLFADDGTLRLDARVFIGGDEPAGDPLAAPLADGEVVTILAPIAGA